MRLRGSGRSDPKPDPDNAVGEHMIWHPRFDTLPIFQNSAAGDGS